MSRCTFAFPLFCAFTLLRAQTPIVDNSTYKVVLEEKPVPALIVFSEGQHVFRLPVASGLSTTGQEEILSNIQMSPRTQDNLLSVGDKLLSGPIAGSPGHSGPITSSFSNSRRGIIRSSDVTFSPTAFPLTGTTARVKAPLTTRPSMPTVISRRASVMPTSITSQSQCRNPSESLRKHRKAQATIR